MCRLKKKVLRNKWQRTWAQCDLGDMKIPRWLARTWLLSTSHVCLCACCVTNWLKKKILLVVFGCVCVCVWVTHTESADTVSQVWRTNLRRYVLHIRSPGGSWSLFRTLVTSWFSLRARRSKVRRVSVGHHGTCKTKKKCPIYKEAWLSVSGALWQQGWVWITVARLSFTLVRCLADTVPFMGFLLISAKAVKQAGSCSH